MGVFDDSVGDTVFVSMLTSFVGAADKWYPELIPWALNRQLEVKATDKAEGVRRD